MWEHFPPRLKAQTDLILKIPKRLFIIIFSNAKNAKNFFLDVSFTKILTLTKSGPKNELKRTYETIYTMYIDY